MTSNFPRYGSPTLKDPQRLLSQHQLRWQQESIKQREQDVKLRKLDEARHKATQKRISRIIFPCTRELARVSLYNDKWKCENSRLKTQIIELQRKCSPREEHSFDRIDPNTLPPRNIDWRWQPTKTARLATVLPPGRRYSVRDALAPSLQFKPPHSIWIQEGLRMRVDLRDLMFKHRALNEYTAYDVGNRKFPILF